MSMKRLLSIAALLATLAFTPFTDAQTANSLDQDGKGKTTQILFFREHHFTGSALKPSIFVDDKEVNRLPNGHWFLLNVEPGKHRLQSSAKNEPATVVEVAQGETLYVQMVILMGNWRGGGRLLAVDSKEAQEKVAKLKLNEKERP